MISFDWTLLSPSKRTFSYRVRETSACWSRLNDRQTEQPVDVVTRVLLRGISPNTENTMRKSLTQIGNSRGIILDRSILSLLKLNEDTVFEITTDGTKLVLEPVRESDVAPKMPATVTSVNVPAQTPTNVFDATLRRTVGR